MTLSCTNRGKPLLNQQDIQTFMKVICCKSCHKIVTQSYERGVRLVNSVLDLYKESLRLALVKKQAHLPVLPKGDMPMSELAAEMNMLEVLRANGAKGQQTRKDQV